MTENKRFVNKGKDIFQYGKWWCSANGEHCADVIATAINELIEENEQLKLISNYRGEMVSFATSLIQDMGSEEMLKMWNDFTEFMYQKWKKKRGIK